MHRRVFRIISSLGLSIFFLFMLASTSIPASAHEVSNRPTPAAHTISNRPNVVVLGDIVCAPYYFSNSNAWVYTGNGPSSSGCGGHAWEARTPTQAEADYDMGYIGAGGGSYHLRAFITGPASAPMNYEIFIDNSFLRTCYFNQSQGIAWTTIPNCGFTLNGGNAGQELYIVEWSGSATPHTLSASAMQIMYG